MTCDAGEACPQHPPGYWNTWKPSKIGRLIGMANDRNIYETACKGESKVYESLPHALRKEIEAEVNPVVAKEQRVLPDSGGIREQYPLFDGLMAYFPAALCEVARWSIVGNAKHNPGEPLHWAREKSTDHENKIMRHLLDARAVDKDGFVEAVALAWRALALCQTILEERGWAEGKNGKWNAKEKTKIEM